MERYCHACGRQFSETEENKNVIAQGKCPYCGAALVAPMYESTDENTPKTPFEEKKTNGKKFGKRERKNRSSKNSAAQSDVRYLRLLGRRKVLFVLAFVGLLLDFIYGIGAALCLPVAVVACRDLSFLHKRKGAPSTQLVWAAVVGFLGALLGIVFFVLMI